MIVKRRMGRALPFVAIGPFVNRASAETFCNHLLQEGRVARIKKFVNGVLVDEQPSIE